MVVKHVSDTVPVRNGLSRASLVLDKVGTFRHWTIEM